MNKKHYLTKEGLEKFKKELDSLLEIRKEKMKEKVPEVLHSEDLNPEYLDFREIVQLIEKRIFKLEEVLRDVEIVKTPKDKKIVQIGAKIHIEADNQADVFFIVDSIEANPSEGKISGESLVGKKLLGKKEGDLVSVSSKIATVYKIVKIEY